MIEYKKYTKEWEDRVFARIEGHQEESETYKEMKPDALWVRCHLRCAEDYIIMATDGETLAGFIWVAEVAHWFTPERGASDLVLSVDPIYRNGIIGKRLIRKAEELAADLGLAYFQLSTAFRQDRDDRTIKYYQRLGYSPRGSAVFKSLRR